MKTVVKIANNSPRHGELFPPIDGIQLLCDDSLVAVALTEKVEIENSHSPFFKYHVFAEGKPTSVSFFCNEVLDLRPNSQEKIAQEVAEALEGIAGK